MRMLISAAALLFAVVIPMTACSGGEPRATAAQAAKANAECERDPLQCELRDHPAPKVNGVRAMDYVRSIVALGPRHPGSRAHRQFGTMLRRNLGQQLESDSFTVTGPGGKPVKLTNYTMRFPGKSDRIVILASHYDTKVNIPAFVGANDGGSSSGLLLELGQQLRLTSNFGQRDGHTVWLVWFDGEEAFEEQMTEQNALFGSRRMAAQLRKDGIADKVTALILMDMVGDAELRFLNEGSSTPELMKLVREVGGKLGYAAHFDTEPFAIIDDHVPFVQQGIPAVDLIDFNYGPENSYWHTRQDTLDKLSPRSLEITGNTVLQSLWVLDTRLKKAADSPPAK